MKPKNKVEVEVCIEVAKHLTTEQVEAHVDAVLESTKHVILNGLNGIRFSNVKLMKN